MINLLIADDHTVLREGIKRILESAPDINIVAEAESGDDLIRSNLNDIHILLLDISMPGAPFIDVMRHCTTNFPHVNILILSTHPEEQYAISALKAGASGYLTKNHSPTELISAIRHINSGRKYISHSLGEQLANQLESNIEKKQHDCLSKRELEIMCMIGRGIQPGIIAKSLSLSPKTISTYRKRIFEKMNFKNNAELIVYTMKNKLND